MDMLVVAVGGALNSPHKYMYGTNVHVHVGYSIVASATRNHSVML